MVSLVSSSQFGVPTMACSSLSTPFRHVRLRHHFSLEVIQNCNNFHERQQRMMGGGQGKRYAFLKCRLWYIAILWRGLEINIFKVLFWSAGGHKKITLCTLFIMLTIQDDPYRAPVSCILCTFSKFPVFLRWCYVLPAIPFIELQDYFAKLAANI